MVRKHKEVFEKGASVDMSDLEKDPIVMFQKKWVSTVFYPTAKEGFIFRAYIVFMMLTSYLLNGWMYF